MKACDLVKGSVVELDGDVATDEGASLMRELAPLCDRLKLVGSFYTH